MKIEDYLEREFGYNKAGRENWLQAINNWRSWYSGYNQNFHNYEYYNGKSHIKMRRYSAQMAKKCCEDWADLLFNVNCKVEVANESNDDLQKILAKNGFWLLVNQSVEKSFSVGTGALILSINGIEHNEGLNTINVVASEPHIEYIEVEKIYPISWDNQFISECAFATVKVIHGNKYMFLSVHVKPGKNYVIYNRVFSLSESGDISELSEEDERNILGSLSVFDTKSNKRWFCIVSPAIANNIAFGLSDYPFGMSIFANAIDCIKLIDLAFDSAPNELKMGRKRIFVRSGLLDNVNGEKVFDASDISVYELPDGKTGSDLLQPDNTELRIIPIEEALKVGMSMFSNNVGMGKDMYSFETANISTAAQVYSTNSELKRHRDKHKTKLENELYDLLQALCYASTAFSHYNINAEGLSIIFDDSMFEDISSESQRKLQEINSDVAARYEYRMTVLKEDEETAKKKIAEIDEEKRKAMMNYSYEDE